MEEPLDCGICFLPLHAPPVFMVRTRMQYYIYPIQSKQPEAIYDVLISICTAVRSWAPDLLALPRNARAGRGDVPRLQCQGRPPGSRRDDGRDVWPVYYAPRDRIGALRGPCRCPDNACGFVGNTRRSSATSSARTTGQSTPG
ncbi:hypothetical protein D1007_55760 [Hordeum vulgare]|nr:hypothetical protein D1007_55760 [Hordeum vulgare]